MVDCVTPCLFPHSGVAQTRSCSEVVWTDAVYTRAMQLKPKLHKYDLRGRHDLDWITIHHYYIESWEARRNHLIRANATSTSFGYNHPYMMWYCTTTHLFITPHGSSLKMVVIFVIICFYLLFYFLYSF